MGIKASVKEKKVVIPDSDFEYPLLMTSINQPDLVILAFRGSIDAIEGMVVRSNMYFVGYVCKVWNPSVFIPYKGTIKIKNANLVRS